MPKFTMSGTEGDDRPNYNEVVGGNVGGALEKRKGYLRGGIKINGVDFRNFETNSPENLVAQLNSRFGETGVFAEIDGGGNIKLSHRSDAPILLASSAPYQPPRTNPDESPPAPYEENTVLADLGLDETTEENAAAAAQFLTGNGLVPQVGNGPGQAAGMAAPIRRGQGPFQTADEIEAMNRAIMSNPRGISGTMQGFGGRAPSQPHESVPGTLTTGNRPIAEAPDSNAQRVTNPDPNTALSGQPLRAESAAAGAGLQTSTSGATGEREMTDAEANADVEYSERTVEDLREHARENDINLQGASTKADIIRAIKKHDRKKAKEPA